MGERLLDPLRAVAVERASTVSWSARVVDARPPGGILDDLDGDAVLPTASVGKLFLLLTVIDQVGSGGLDPAEALAVAPGTLVGDSGLLQFLDRRTLSVGDLCRLVAAVSDNLATNVLIARVGLAAIQRTTERIGIERSRLLDAVRDVRGPADPPFLSTGCATELAELMAAVHDGRVLDPAGSRALVDLLRLNTDLSMVAAATMLDPLAHTGADLGLSLYNKTGSDSGTRADVGVIEASASGDATRALSYAVIARFDDSATTRRAVLDSMRAVGERVVAAVRSGRG